MRGKRRAPRFAAVRFPNAIEGDVQHQGFPELMHRAEADGGIVANLPAEERQLLVSNPNYAFAKRHEVQISPQGHVALWQQCPVRRLAGLARDPSGVASRMPNADQTLAMFGRICFRKAGDLS